MVSHADFRRFAVRNEVWPQEAGTDLSRQSWSAGRVVHKPDLDFRTADKPHRRFRAEVYVLVGAGGKVLDKKVTCSSDPTYNEQLLKAIDLFVFEPSRYNGRELNTMMPVGYDL